MLDDNRIVQLLDRSIIEAADLAVKSIKVNRALNIEYLPSKAENEAIAKVLSMYEFAIIDLWKYAFDASEADGKKRNEFVLISKECFTLLQALPFPDDPVRKMVHVLKLFTFSYLGEKWEDMRRFLFENPTLFEIDNQKKDDWDMEVFVTIYRALLFLIRKNSWQDLTTAIELVNNLRIHQREYEESYLRRADDADKKNMAYELAALYHLAKSVDLMAEYMIKGNPHDIQNLLDFHFGKAVAYSRAGKIIELDLVLRMLHYTLKKMVNNSIWAVTQRVNDPKISKFAESVTKSEKPIFELLYPQRVAIIDKGLLNLANRAIVVNLPTSSGKTIIAEFKILQALNQFSANRGWLAYVAPTRALVNQIASKLRRDLSPMDIRVERMSGAIEIDSFEEEMIKSSNKFDILVTTPEKLHLLIRQGVEKKLGRPLSLVIIDEAHNIGDKERGLNLEMLISTIKRDSKNANLLLLTPFIPNIEKVAKWLDPDHPATISIGLDWQPNERVIGLIFAEGSRRSVRTLYKPLVTSHQTLEMAGKKIVLSETDEAREPISKIQKNKSLLTSLAAKRFLSSDNTLILCRTVDDTWKVAKKVFEDLGDERELNEKITLVQRFVSAELGSDFPLVKYLGRGIGVHNAGLPEDIRFLIEDLMEEGLLRILVSTTTIAQGINFPVSTILMASYSYPYTDSMPARDFWNLAGRAGRVDQPSVGLIGIAVDKEESQDSLKATRFVQESTEELISVLVGMVDQALLLGNSLNLEALAYYPQWSTFLQYIAHMYKQSQNLQSFVSEVELTLQNTYGYNDLPSEKKEILLDAVKEYAKKLDGDKKLSTLSDLTGFSPETIESTIGKINDLGLKESEWNTSRLFSGSSDTLRNLTGILLNSIPEMRNKFEIKAGGDHLSEKQVAMIISAWVSGRDIIDISRQYFGGTKPDSVTECVIAIHKNIANFAAWGLAAIQKLPGSGINFDRLSEQERRKLNNIPAMVYYGVSKDSAILMRMHNVPRSISHQLGRLYEAKGGQIYTADGSSVLEWLKSLNDSEWNKVVPKGKRISGQDYKRVWKKLAGMT